MSAVFAEVTEASGGHKRLDGELQFLLHAVERAVQTVNGAVHEAGRHGVHRIGADDVVRRLETDGRQLGGTVGQGVERNGDARCNGAAEEFAGRTQCNDFGGSAEVGNEAGEGILLFGCYGYGDKVGAEAGRWSPHSSARCSARERPN